LNKKSALEIQQSGLWTSNMFLEYIHCQLNVSSKGLAEAMSTDIPFMNMAKSIEFMVDCRVGEHILGRFQIQQLQFLSLYFSPTISSKGIHPPCQQPTESLVDMSHWFGWAALGWHQAFTSEPSISHFVFSTTSSKMGPLHAPCATTSSHALWGKLAIQLQGTSQMGSGAGGNSW